RERRRVRYLYLLTLFSVEFSIWISKKITIPKDIDHIISGFTFKFFELVYTWAVLCQQLFWASNKFPSKNLWVELCIESL
ncbi:hypothetical protein VIGAN_08153500, partial [Vigna angularis var. angularis]